MATTTRKAPAAPKNAQNKGTAVSTRKTAPVATEAQQAAAEVHEVQAVETLVAAWKQADSKFSEHMSAWEAAKAGVSMAMVWKSRAAFLLASHPSFKRGSQPYNITKAAKALGMSDNQRNTLRPYVNAGDALFRAGRLYALDVTPDDVTVVDNVFNDGERLRKQLERAIAAIGAAKSAAAVEDKAAKAMTLAEAHPTDPTTAKRNVTNARTAALAKLPALEAGTGEDSGEGTDTGTAPAAKSAPREVTLQEDILETVSRLLASARLASKNHAEIEDADKETIAAALAEVSGLLELA